MKRKKPDIAAAGTVDERTARLQALLDRLNPKIVAAFKQRILAGVQPRDLAAVVVVTEDGEAGVVVDDRKQITGLLLRFGREGAMFAKYLEEPSPSGAQHCVFVMRRAGNLLDFAYVQTTLERPTLH